MNISKILRILTLLIILKNAVIFLLPVTVLPTLRRLVKKPARNMK